jgi:deoxyribose-phosphate aldolase
MTFTAELAGRLDHTISKAEAVSAEVHRVASEAMRLGCRAVVAAPVWTNRLARMVQGSGVRVVSTVAFPFGTSKPTVKAIEATSTIKDGAEEIEVVAHLPAVLSLDVESARAELMEIVRAARSTRRETIIRVIVECGLLMQLPDDRRERTIETACRAIRESGCDGIVTSSGFHAATPDASAVSLVKRCAEGLTVKAVVGDDAGAAHDALAAGADLVGMTAAAGLLEL